MDPKAFVAGMSALGAGMAMIAAWPWYRRGLCRRSGVLRNRPSAGAQGDITRTMILVSQWQSPPVFTRWLSR